MLLAYWHKPVTVGRNGISVTIKGEVFHYGQYAECLKKFKLADDPEERIVNVSIDLSATESVRVFDRRFRPVGVVTMNRVGGVVKGIAVEDHAALHGDKGADRKLLKHQPNYSLTPIYSNEERVADAALKRRREEQQAAAAAAQPATMTIVRTRFDAQSKYLQKQELKIAVGAESLSEPATPRVDIFESARRRSACYTPENPPAAPCARSS